MQEEEVKDEDLAEVKMTVGLVLSMAAYLTVAGSAVWFALRP